MIRFLLLSALLAVAGVLLRGIAGVFRPKKRPKKTPPPEGFEDAEDAEFTEV